MIILWNLWFFENFYDSLVDFTKFDLTTQFSYAFKVNEFQVRLHE